jgi:quinol monooxygenase YgiN
MTTALAPTPMTPTELVIFARFRALQSKETEVAAELRATVARVAVEPGCRFIQVYRSLRDSRLFWLHSRWSDETAFNVHAELPATAGFLDKMRALIDHPLDVTRAQAL